jgi:alpha-D-ribose 1-methylphosphonate 5-triphosphate diphosphatase
VEVCHPEIVSLVEPFLDEPLLRVVSLMDHTPGARQWADVERYRELNEREYGRTSEQVTEFIRNARERQERYAEPNRQALLEALSGRGLTLANHDDTTVEHAAQAAAAGLRISEFPTTLEAAREARRLGMKIVMGAPNVILGRSHSGNVSAMDLARHGLLDSLSSDYAPVSLLHAVFRLSRDLEIPLHDAVAMATANTAEMLGLADRGEIAIGKRADLVRVKHVGDVPMARGVWRAGERVA